MEDNICVEEWVATCGKAVMGVDICESAGTGDGVAAERCI